MNRWECEYPSCKSKAVGEGGAIGLRAIGWHFTIGGQILCPRHRPDQIPCVDNADNAGNLCSLCSAVKEAQRLQDLIEKAL